MRWNMKTFIAPAPAHVLLAVDDCTWAGMFYQRRAPRSLSPSPRAGKWIRIRAATARGPALQFKAIFAGHLAGPTADPIASNCHDTLAHAHGRSGTKRRDDPIPRCAARSLPRRGAPRGGDDHAVGGVDRRVAR